jgi:hypothetical protein
MPKYPVALLRERLALALDQAERGEPVFIERKGVRYRLSVEPLTKRRRSRKPKITVLDAAVAAGEWTWDWRGGQARFRARRA